MESNKISSPQGPQPAHGARPRSTANTQDAGEAGSGGMESSFGFDDPADEPGMSGGGADGAEEHA